MPTPSPHQLFDPVAPFDTRWLTVPGGHEIHVEQSGAPDGRPVLLLHGGPGSSASAMQRRFFDPGRYRIVQFDQRGCGRSRSADPLRHNHAAALIDDIERIRESLGIARWLVSGGSWGATLAACYAAAHRGAVDGLLLRALFLTGRGDLEWFFGGAGACLPAEWQRFVDCVPRSRRRSLRPWLWRVFAAGDEATIQRVAAAWRRWEAALQGNPPPAEAPDAAVVRRYRIQAHYLARECFLGERRVIAAIARLHGLPVLFVHGRRDLVCRPANGWKAWCSLSGSRLLWVDEAGHDPFSPAMARALRQASDHWLQHATFAPIGEIRTTPWR